MLREMVLKRKLYILMPKEQIHYVMQLLVLHTQKVMVQKLGLLHRTLRE